MFLSSSSTFIDNKESYKQILCVEHFYMRSNIFRNIFVFCKKHDFLLQKGTMKLTTARLNNLPSSNSSTEIHSIISDN